MYSLVKNTIIQDIILNVIKPLKGLSWLVAAVKEPGLVMDDHDLCTAIVDRLETHGDQGPISLCLKALTSSKDPELQISASKAQLILLALYYVQMRGPARLESSPPVTQTMTNMKTGQSEADDEFHITPEKAAKAVAEYLNAPT